MSEHTRLLAAAVEKARREPDSRGFVRTFRRTYVELLAAEAAIVPSVAEEAYDTQQFDRLRERLLAAVATGAAVSGPPRLTAGFEHAVALGQLLYAHAPGFKKMLVGVQIRPGAVLTVKHGGIPARVAYGANLGQVTQADTEAISPYAAHATADAMVTLLTSAAPITTCEMATRAEFQAVSTGTLVGFDSNGQRIEQDLDILNCRGAQLRPWEFVAAATTSPMTTLGPGDSGSPFYINVNGNLRVAGLFVHAVDSTGDCAPAALFTRIDYVRDWALAPISHFDNLDRTDNR